jgi:hypothetical protein
VEITARRPTARIALKLRGAQRAMIDGPAIRCVHAIGLPWASSPAAIRS